MSHPVQPKSYIEISNFYTLTIYEKGAEIIRMMHNLLGEKHFRQGSDLYFERHDGQAVTIEAFVQAMQDASGIDLSQFSRWYHQQGTPRLQVSESFDGGVYALWFKQVLAKGQESLHIPVSIGLLDPSGREKVSQLLEVEQAEQTFEFPGWNEKPIPSLFRGFSAPIKLEYNYTHEHLLFLMQHDSDAFNRWDAGQRLAVKIIQENIEHVKTGKFL